MLKRIAATVWVVILKETQKLPNVHKNSLISNFASLKKCMNMVPFKKNLLLNLLLKNGQRLKNFKDFPSVEFDLLIRFNLNYKAAQSRTVRCRELKKCLVMLKNSRRLPFLTWELLLLKICTLGSAAADFFPHYMPPLYAPKPKVKKLWRTTRFCTESSFEFGDTKRHQK